MWVCQDGLETHRLKIILLKAIKILPANTQCNKDASIRMDDCKQNRVVITAATVYFTLDNL